MALTRERGEKGILSVSESLTHLEGAQMFHQLLRTGHP